MSYVRSLEHKQNKVSLPFVRVKKIKDDYFPILIYQNIDLGGSPLLAFIYLSENYSTSLCINHARTSLECFEQFFFEFLHFGVISYS
jgi:hypothetical protein